MPEAILSNAIAAVASQGTDAAFSAFMAVFLDASVGLVAENIPAGRRPGETFQTGPTDRMTLALVGAPDGRRMVKACADPATFVRKYPDTKINVLMVGRELLQMVGKVPDLDGVLVCSATQVHSVPISRAEAARALAPHRAKGCRPWWRPWG